MDWRLVKHLLSRFSSREFDEAGHRARRYTIAALRSGAPVQDVERARTFTSMVRFCGRIAEAAKRVLENINRTLRHLLGSAPPRTMPHCLLSVLAVPTLSIPALSDPIGLTHAPHAPPLQPPYRSLAAVTLARPQSRPYTPETAC